MQKDRGLSARSSCSTWVLTGQERVARIIQRFFS